MENPIYRPLNAPVGEALVSPGDLPCRSQLPQIIKLLFASQIPMIALQLLAGCRGRPEKSLAKPAKRGVVGAAPYNTVNTNTIV